jgi:serine protease Do
MRMWKPAALRGALVLAIAAPVVTAVVRGQSRDHEPLMQAFEWIGRGAQIGVQVRDVGSDDSKTPPGGVIVDEVQADSPAEKAGIKAGDTILEFDGERVRSAKQFSRLVQETPVGRTVQAVLSRHGQHVTVSVAPERSSGALWVDDLGVERWEDGARSWAYRVPPPPAPPSSPAPPTPPRAPRPPAVAIPAMPGFDFEMFGRGGRLGVSIESLTPQLEEYFGVKDGVLVRSVSEGSPAAKAGLRAGDVITAVNGSAVSDPSDLSGAINRLDSNAQFSLEIVRDKKPQTIKGKIEEKQERLRSRAIV